MGRTHTHIANSIFTNTPTASPHQLIIATNAQDELLGGLKALVLTKDHLAMHAAERARIEKAGGHVTADGRLNGRIQVNVYGALGASLL